MSRSARRPRLFLARASIRVILGQGAGVSGWLYAASLTRSAATLAQCGGAGRVLVVLPSAAPSPPAAGASSRAQAAPGMIVFASDRAKVDPGEIYSLAPERLRATSRAASPATTAWQSLRSAIRSHSGAVAAAGSASTSRAATDRAAPPRRRRRFRRRRRVGRLVFSADGKRLFASLRSRRGLVVDTRRATARRVPASARHRAAVARREARRLRRTQSDDRLDLAGHAAVRATGESGRTGRAAAGSRTAQPGSDRAGAGGPAAVFDASGRRRRARARAAGRLVARRPVCSSSRRGQSLRIAGAGATRATSRLMLAKWGGGRGVVHAGQPLRLGRRCRRPRAAHPARRRARRARARLGKGAWSPRRAPRLRRLPRAVPEARWVERTASTSPTATAAIRASQAASPSTTTTWATCSWLPGGRRVLFLHIERLRRKRALRRTRGRRRRTAA